MKVIDGKYEYNNMELAVIKFANYLIENSCFYDLDNYHNFRAVDIDDLDDLVKDFFNKGI